MSSQPRTRTRGGQVPTPPTSAPRRRGKVVPAESTAIPVHPPNEPINTVNHEEKKEEVPENVQENTEQQQEETVIAQKQEEVDLNKQEVQTPQISTEDGEAEEVVEMKTFSIRRIKSTFGISHFELTHKGQKLMIGEYKSPMFGTATVKFSPVNAQNTINAAIMAVSEKDTKFIVTQGTKKIADVSIFRPGQNDNFPRQWELTLFEDNDVEKHLYSKSPTLNKNGQYVLNFGGRITVNSVKNCILIDRDENFEVIGVRKIEKNTLEIDARSDFSELEVFLLGTAAFLAN